MTAVPLTSAPALGTGTAGAPHASLRRWLVACIVAVFLAVSVGGITRLTESGLSITEWKPVSGVMPPSTPEAWAVEFEKFQRIPQAQTTHAGMTIAEFKLIFWWEWFHRIIARTVGLVFAIPFLWFLAKGTIPRSLRVRLAWLPFLTLCQGVLGWYMVSSGLSVRTEVSPYRLAAHLSLALAILVIALWTWADLTPREDDAPASGGWRTTVNALTALIAITIVTGAFVAGLRAGKIFNEFPLMGGQVVPPGYLSIGGWWRNALENPVAAQFHHRTLAILVAGFALVVGWRARAAALSLAQQRAMQRLVLAVVVQVIVGIVTLLWAVPVALGALHQFTGVVLLTAAVLAMHAMRPAPARIA